MIRLVTRPDPIGDPAAPGPARGGTRGLVRRAAAPVLATLLALLTAGCSDGGGGATPGPLAVRARAYDEWHRAHHQPLDGATVSVKFADETLEQAATYHGRGDSTIWTGTYLASQAFRHAVTGEAEARENVLAMVDTLHHHLRVTGKPGFIGRYRAPATAPGVVGCGATDENCHVVDSGPYAGDLWFGNTSRDQYTGWFFGYAAAYDLVDDEAMRATIRQDVTEVIDAVVAQDYLIVDVDGIATTAGPEVLPPFAAAWHLIAYHVAGREQDLEAFRAVVEAETFFRISAISLFNRYTEYYGNNLSHENFYHSLRLSEGLPERDTLLAIFTEQTHANVHLSHNAFFELIHLTATGENEGGMAASIVEDLTAFRDPPNRSYAVDPPAAPLDPFSVALVALQTAFPELADLAGDAHVQAAEAYPVPEQCSTDFLWQRNPFRLDCGGREDLAFVEPGVDYLVAYWMARHHGLLGPSD